MSNTTAVSGGTSKLDVLIPAIEKDLANLPFVIDHLRKMVRHNIGSIYIVSPVSPAIKRLCREKGCVFVDENTVLPITKKHIRYRSKKWDRSGWMFQQLLKLGGDKIATTSRYLVMDADTVLIRPHTFLSEGRTVAYSRSWSQPEYFKTYRKLLGRKHGAPRSFVAHYMLFDKKTVRELKKTIEARHGMPWYAAILKNINTAGMFAFSEFETYGNYLYNKSPGRVVFKNTLNRSLSADFRTLSPGRLRQLARSYRSLSIHKRRGYYLKKRAAPH